MGTSVHTELRDSACTEPLCLMATPRGVDIEFTTTSGSQSCPGPGSAQLLSFVFQCWNRKAEFILAYLGR